MVLMYLRRVRNFFIWLSVSFLFLVKIRFRGGVYGFSTIDACKEHARMPQGKRELQPCRSMLSTSTFLHPRNMTLVKN